MRYFSTNNPSKAHWAEAAIKSLSLGIAVLVTSNVANAQNYNSYPAAPSVYAPQVQPGFSPNVGAPVGSPYTPLQNGVLAPTPQSSVYQQSAQQSPYQAPYQAVAQVAPTPVAMPQAAPQSTPAVPNIGYGIPQSFSQPYAYPNTVLAQPAYSGPATFGANNEPLPRLAQPWPIEPNTTALENAPFGYNRNYNPRIIDAPIDVYVQEGQTGRISLGGAVNSDLGVSGQLIIEERNFDLFAWPNSQAGLLNGAFRGAGQNLRIELMPGNNVQRYTVNWTTPNLFGYSPFSLSVGGFYFTRFYDDWSEQRVGGRIGVGYEITPDLSLTTEFKGQDVKIFDPSTNSLPALNRVLGSNDLYTGSLRLAHNTRNHQFMPTDGHFLEFILDQHFGEFDFPRAQVNWSKYYKVRSRADDSGAHTFTNSIRLGFSGKDTPIFENFFAGGYSTLRGFAFRGAGPVEMGVQTGGRFQLLGSLEYMAPLTADDMVRMVGFVDYGTVEQDIEINWDNFRVAPGFGFRVSVPALGPAPLALDFAFPVAHADDDDRRVFAFSMGAVR